MKFNVQMHLIGMKCNLIFFFLINFYSFGQIDSNKLTVKDTVIYTSIDINVMHYSGEFDGLRSNGHIHRDSIGNMVSNSMYCRSFEDSTIFYYRLTYYSKGKISYDSIVDFREKKWAKSIILKYDSEGQKVYTRIIKAKLDPKRKDIPIRSETMWNGKETYFNNKGRKTSKKKIENEIY
jgi:hypothetical protein